jgi:DNA-binding NtrC family response regulator
MHASPVWEEYLVNTAASGPADHTERADEILLLDNDLYFSVKIADTLKHVGYHTHTVRQLDAFSHALAEAPPVLVLVNTGSRGLDWRAAIAAARQARVAIVAFGSHIDLQMQQEARDLGATSVISNSRLASDLPGVVARALRRANDTGGDTDAPGPIGGAAQRELGE